MGPETTDFPRSSLDVESVPKNKWLAHGFVLALPLLRNFTRFSSFCRVIIWSRGGQAKSILLPAGTCTQGYNGKDTPKYAKREIWPSPPPSSIKCQTSRTFPHCGVCTRTAALQQSKLHLPLPPSSVCPTPATAGIVDSSPKHARQQQQLKIPTKIAHRRVFFCHTSTVAGASANTSFPRVGDGTIFKWPTPFKCYK